MIENMEDRIMYEEVIEKINTADYEDAYKLIVDIKKNPVIMMENLQFRGRNMLSNGIQAGDVPCNRQGNTD